MTYKQKFDKFLKKKESNYNEQPQKSRNPILSYHYCVVIFICNSPGLYRPSWAGRRGVFGRKDSCFV